MGHFALTKDVKKLIKERFIRPPEHLFYFNKQSIKQLFLSHGFTRIKFMISLKPTIKMLGFKN
jgi:citrate lyase synthetase